MATIACISVECPPEVLLELHVSPGEMADAITEKAALAFFREGRLSSGLAAKWVGEPRATFLLKAMAQGARLLDQGDIDYRRESAL
jgi:hypothetical protein